jgi:hypothetical protein
MSLIQEALKRQQEEAKKQGTSTTETAQPAGQEPPVTRGTGLQVAQTAAPPPPPVPENSAAPAEEQQAQEPKGPSKGKKIMGLALRIIPVVLILIAGGFWIAKSFVAGGAKPVPQAPAPPTPAATATNAQPTQPKPGTTQPTAATQPAPTAPETSNTTVETTPVVTTPTEPPQNTEPAQTTEVATTETNPSAPDVKPPPMPWPVLTVTGVIGRGQKGAAKINNVIVDVGQSIDGVKVVSLGSRSVELEYLGQRRDVRVGSSTQ